MPPSELLGLTRGSYEAYCFDEAIWYFGTTVESKLEEASQPKGKRSKGQAQAEAARKRVMAKYFGEGNKGMYADPAAMFMNQ